MDKSEEMDKSGDETFLDKSGIDEIPLIIKPRLGSSPGKEKSGQSCIVLVGTTGTGKTSALNIYTGNDLKVGEGAQSVTGTTMSVEDKIHPGGPKWIDNPGWSDSEGRSDNLVFKDLLRHMQDNQEYCVKAVVWCIMPTPRMDANLQAQAKFIDMFTPDDEKTTENEAGKIWNNVVIICKGKINPELSADVQGAVMASKQNSVHADPFSIRYEFASPEVLEGTNEKLRVDSLRMLTTDEIRSELEVLFSKLPVPVPVVFANQKCLSCGQTGDPRLMTDTCHRNKKKGHKGQLEQRFSRPQVGAAMGFGAVGTIGLSIAAAAAATPTVLIGLPLVLIPGLCMGGHRFLNTSAEGVPPCGGLKFTDMRWSCCNSPELATGGCSELCDLCEEPWGSSAKPCVMIKHPDINMQKDLDNYQFHDKTHDLVHID